MTVTQLESTRTSVSCTSTTTASTQVEADFKVDQTSLYDQLFDGLSRLHYTPAEVKIVMDILEELGTAAYVFNQEYLDDRNIFAIQMDMDGHELLDAVMADKAIAADGSLHELANKVFLPAGKTFVHDVTDFCVIEVRNVVEEEDVD